MKRLSITLYTLLVYFIFPATLQPQGSTGAPHPVILISIDGFRNAYLDSFPAPNIKRLAREGARADAMRPAFPSLTFPAHYTLITGLHPEEHGITSNSVYDSASKRTLSMKNTYSATWWKWRGEPVWVTAEKQGVKSAAMFWPSSDAVIWGHRPTYWERYNSGFPYEQRVARILDWLDKPANVRPLFMTLYFEDVDEAGHKHGPWSVETQKAVARVDSMIGLLMLGLEERKRQDSVNIIVTADHGMTAVSPRRTVFLSDVVDAKTVITAESGPYMWIHARDGNHARLLSRVKRLPHIRTYLREKTPLHLHVHNHPNRFGILVLADDGWVIQKSRTSRQNIGGMIGAALYAEPETGRHGYDSSYESMKVLFVARGPGFKAGSRAGEFESVEVYGVVTHLLGLKAAGGTGRVGVLNGALVSHPPPGRP